MSTAAQPLGWVLPRDGNSCARLTTMQMARCSHGQWVIKFFTLSTTTTTTVEHTLIDNANTIIRWVNVGEEIDEGVKKILITVYDLISFETASLAWICNIELISRMCDSSFPHTHRLVLYRVNVRWS